MRRSYRLHVWYFHFHSGILTFKSLQSLHHLGSDPAERLPSAYQANHPPYDLPADPGQVPHLPVHSASQTLRNPFLTSKPGSLKRKKSACIQ